MEGDGGLIGPAKGALRLGLRKTIDADGVMRWRATKAFALDGISDVSEGARICQDGFVVMPDGEAESIGVTVAGTGPAKRAGVELDIEVFGL